jgi:hypothetical protein
MLIFCHSEQAGCDHVQKKPDACSKNAKVSTDLTAGEMQEEDPPRGSSAREMGEAHSKYGELFDGETTLFLCLRGQ